MFAEFFKESDRAHTCPAVAMSYQREEWTRQTRCAVFTDTKYSNWDNKESVMPLLIYPEDSNYN